MLRRFLLAALLALAPNYVLAADIIGGGVIGGPTVAAYSGPGDVVTGAKAWWGLRGYNTAYSGNAANICTPLDAVCLDVAIVAGNLNATTLGTLACNNTTTLCTVKVLYDQSGSLFCASSTACDLTHATIANRPLYVAPGAANGCPSTGLPCMSFNGSSQCLPNISGRALTLTVPSTAITAAVRTSGSSFSTAYSVGNQDSELGFNTANNAYVWNGSASTNKAATDSTWHALGALVGAPGDSPVINVNGSSTAASGTQTTTSNQQYGIGSYINTAGSCNSQFLTGKIVEAGLWQSSFTGTQFTNMSANIHSYWGF